MAATLPFMWILYQQERKMITGLPISLVISCCGTLSRATGYWKTNSVKYNFLLIAHEYLFVFRK